ncbi:PP2C family protein-serine/threonine phosphatase [uncultured Endozoicomonas sp.]|uniref:PP2C family serine/threonine-protein phosphatase n=1 Tax=uncultured Endozoicomonas sp. TaxID=432652 RepID=UPI002618E973|nr:PP2C family protein-serine/threonine phosphatase [uncultured Endozoicomonas sp.]
MRLSFSNLPSTSRQVVIAENAFQPAQKKKITFAERGIVEKGRFKHSCISKEDIARVFIRDWCGTDDEKKRLGCDYRIRTEDALPGKNKKNLALAKRQKAGQDTRDPFEPATYLFHCDGNKLNLDSMKFEGSNEFVSRLRTSSATAPNGTVEKVSPQKHPAVGVATATGQAHLSGRGNEDRYVADLRSLWLAGKYYPQVSFTAILDGHGSSQCSQFVQDNLADYLAEALELLTSDRQQLCDHDVYTAIDVAIWRLQHDYFLKQGHSGTTANIAIRIGGHLYVANIGDSQALLVDAENNEYVPLSIDAKFDTSSKPGIEKEVSDLHLKSIYKRGGKISGEDRVAGGGINMARSIGDFRSTGMSCLPTIIKYDLQPGKEYLLVQCSDGFSDIINPRTLAKESAESNRSHRGDAAASALDAMHYGYRVSGNSDRSRDDMTILMLPMKAGEYRERSVAQCMPATSYTAFGSSQGHLDNWMGQMMQSVTEGAENQSAQPFDFNSSSSVESTDSISGIPSDASCAGLSDYKLSRLLSRDAPGGFDSRINVIARKNGLEKEQVVQALRVFLFDEMSRADLKNKKLDEYKLVPLEGLIEPFLDKLQQSNKGKTGTR